MSDGEKIPKRSPINGQPVPSNPLGRPKGLPNKATIEFKEALKNLLDYSAPKMVDWMEELDSAEKRFDVLNKFIEYIHPKLARVEQQALDKDGNATDQAAPTNIYINGVTVKDAAGSTDRPT